MISKPLGDSSFTPKGMLCVTHRRHRSIPITDIGTSDKLYPYSTFASCRSKGVKGVKKLGQYFVAPETSVESSDYGTNVLTPFYSLTPLTPKKLSKCET